MRTLSSSDIRDAKEYLQAKRYLQLAADVALGATCYRSRCGSIIVQADEVIGSGFNSPPAGVTLERCLKDDLPADFKSDKTCCVHAEQRAIRNALRRYPDKLAGSRLYFARLDDDGEIKFAGEPYCTICSKEALDAGIGEFVLWHESGITIYGTNEYNERSFGRIPK